MQIIEHHYGFATYKISGDECYIRDVYVDENFRRHGIASILVDDVRRIAKSHGCKKLTTTVCPSALNSTDSIKAVLGYGFNLHSSINDFIFFRIDI